MNIIEELQSKQATILSDRAAAIDALNAANAAQVALDREIREYFAAKGHKPQ